MRILQGQPVTDCDELINETEISLEHNVRSWPVGRSFLHDIHVLFKCHVINVVRDD